MYLLINVTLRQDMREVLRQLQKTQTAPPQNDLAANTEMQQSKRPQDLVKAQSVLSYLPPLRKEPLSPGNPRLRHARQKSKALPQAGAIAEEDSRNPFFNQAPPSETPLFRIASENRPIPSSASHFFQSSIARLTCR